MTTFFSVNGTSYAADVRGSGPSVVALHAGITTRHMYDPLLAGLEADHRVMAYDQAGFGESGLPSGPVSTALDLLSLMDQAGMHRAVLVGTSFGCRVAFDAALAAPDRVRAIVAAGSGLSGRGNAPVGLDEAFKEVDRAAEAGDLTLANELEMRIWLDGVGRSSPGDAGVRTAVAAMNLSVLERAAAGDEMEELEPARLAADHLADVHCPVLVVMGECDQPHCTETARMIVDQVSNGRLVGMPETAHLPSMERPDEFNRLVREFVAGLS